MKQDDDKNKKADRFRALVDSYGTNPERWPEDQKPSPDELEVAASEAPAWLAEQRRIDEGLDGMGNVVPSGVPQGELAHGRADGCATWSQPRPRRRRWDWSSE